MKKYSFTALASLLVFSAVEPCEAHVLVLRLRLTSTVTESASGTSKSSWPSTLSSLFFLDLDTDYWEDLNDVEANNPDRQWAGPYILLNEQPKSGKTAAQYSFKADDDRNSDSLSAWNVTKFEFYGKNDSKFYLFTHDFYEYETTGVQHASVSFNGLCNLNVNIGGGKISSVPKDGVVTQKKGDNGEFTTNTFSVKYDSVLTKAVNTYLSTEGIQSTKGAKVSVSIPVARNWLAETYLPSRYPATFPYDE